MVTEPLPMSDRREKQSPRRIAVLGGGLCGLSAAFRLRRLLPHDEVHVFEASARFGGVVDTWRHDGLLFETGPLAFPVRSPATAELLSATGQGQLAENIPPPQPAGIWTGRRMAPLSRDPIGILRSRLLSLPCMLRLALEPFIAPSQAEDESVQAFFRRRTGEGFLESVMDPLCSAIQAGDSTRLSMEANFSNLRTWERSVGRMAWKLAKQEWAKAKRPLSPTLASNPLGNACIVDRVCESLRSFNVSLHSGSPVQSLSAEPSGNWVVRSCNREMPFDAVISCLRTIDLQRIFPTAPPAAQTFFAQIRYASIDLVYLAYRRQTESAGFTGAYCMVPSFTQNDALSLSIPSRMQDGRCGKDHELVRVSLGGMRNPEIANLPEKDLYDRASQAVAQILGWRFHPKHYQAIRQPGSLPQLHVGHVARLAKARQSLAQNFPLFILSGTGLVGAGIEKAIAEGKRAADEMVERLKMRESFR